MKTRFLVTETIVITLLATLSCPFSICFAQGTAFTYQGQLTDGGNPAQGIYDLRFTIYDAASDGTLIIGPITNSAVGVSNGLFTTTLDFGGGVFTGGERWLEIAVRTNGSVTDFTVLSPRQAITPTPYALHAKTLSAPLELIAEGSAGTALLSVGSTVEGVAIGASSPNGDFAVLGKDNTAVWGVSSSGFAGFFEGQGFFSGNVGIGTDTPAAKLDVAGGNIFASAGELVTRIDSDEGGALSLLNPRKTGAGQAETWKLYNMTGPYGDSFQIWNYATGVGPAARLTLGDDGTTLLAPSGGNVGIGTSTPRYPLHLKTSWAILGLEATSEGQDAGILLDEAGTNKWRIYNHGSGDDKLYIDSEGAVNIFVAHQNGDIGIGTPTPAAKLDVAGTVRATAFESPSNAPMDFTLAGERVLRFEMNSPNTPNVIAGSTANNVTAGVLGATVAGGYDNDVTANYGTIGGGTANDANGLYATIAGGYLNLATGEGSFVGGGRGTRSPPPVLLYYRNTASGTNSVVTGGYNNTASGSCATVPGGYYNTAAGSYSFAAGYRAKANHAGCFVWGDTTGADIASTAVDQFIVRASGGVRLVGGTELNWGDGSVRLGNESGALRVNGNVRICSPGTGATLIELGEGLDYAEGFDVSESSKPEPGTVLVIDDQRAGHLAVSHERYDCKVAGIVAGANGLGSAVRLAAGGFDCDVALAGRVYCNADASYGEISPGDLLTTSPTPGYAMVVKDRTLAQGAILGKAMQALTGAQKGQILVLVTLQ